jgi:hypothetical protein
MKDLKGEKCTQCQSGHYDETTIFDEWDQILHCTNCSREVKRFEEEEADADRSQD